MQTSKVGEWIKNSTKESQMLNKRSNYKKDFKKTWDTLPETKTLSIKDLEGKTVEEAIDMLSKYDLPPTRITEYKSPLEQKKSKEDYLSEGFSQKEADQMFENQATTGGNNKTINEIKRLETKYKWNPSGMPNEVKNNLQALKNKLKK